MTEQIDRNALASEILLAFWKVHILHHAAKEPIYGLWMLEELRRHGYDLSPGTLYPLLRRMESYGWLKADSKRAVSRRQRRSYRLAPAGAAVLKELRRQVAELYDEVVGPPKQRPARTTTPSRHPVKR